MSKVVEEVKRQILKGKRQLKLTDEHIAALMNTSRQNINSKIRTKSDGYLTSILDQIADAMDMDISISFCPRPLGELDDVDLDGELLEKWDDLLLWFSFDSNLDKEAYKNLIYYIHKYDKAFTKEDGTGDVKRFKTVFLKLIERSKQSQHEVI